MQEEEDVNAQGQVVICHIFRARHIAKQVDVVPEFHHSLFYRLFWVAWNLLQSTAIEQPGHWDDSELVQRKLGRRRVYFCPKREMAATDEVIHEANLLIATDELFVFNWLSTNVAQICAETTRPSIHINKWRYYRSVQKIIVFKKLRDARIELPSLFVLRLQTLRTIEIFK